LQTDETSGTDDALERDFWRGVEDLMRDNRADLQRLVDAQNGGGATMSVTDGRFQLLTFPKRPTPTPPEPAPRPFREDLILMAARLLDFNERAPDAARGMLKIVTRTLDRCDELQGHAPTAGEAATCVLQTLDAYEQLKGGA
jgi:hypothetical protein